MAKKAVTTATGLQLDPAVPGDAKIMDRQRKAAESAGAQGQNRKAVTRGRPDLAEAFDKGAAGTAPAAAEDDGQEQAEDDGQEQTDKGPNAGQKAGEFLSRGSWSPTLTPPSRGRDAGGFAFGLLLYIGVITYLRYGPAGWTGWLSAKFLNKPLQGLPSKKGGPPPTTPPPTTPPERLSA